MDHPCAPEMVNDAMTELLAVTTVARRLGLVALLGVAALALTGCGSGASTTSKSGGGWATVTTFNGSGSAPQITQAFTVHGKALRLVYTVQPNDSGPVPFLSQMFREGTPPGPTTEVSRNVCVSCDGPQTNDLGTIPAGSYYLQVKTSRPWTLSVEERQ
jgi:hypothetical protein